MTIISVYFSSHKNHKIPKTPKKDTSQNHGSSSQPFPAQPSPRLVDVLCASDGQHGQVVRVVPVVPAFQKDRDLGFHLMARWPLEVGNMEIGLDSMLDLFSNLFSLRSRTCSRGLCCKSSCGSMLSSFPSTMRLAVLISFPPQQEFLQGWHGAQQVFWQHLQSVLAEGQDFQV